jgi:low affinity Fe/Cu permease
MRAARSLLQTSTDSRPLPWAAGGRTIRTENAASDEDCATAFAFGLVLVWAVSGPAFHYSTVWQLMMNTLSAVVTFLMVFVLNNAQRRDIAAINAKLDSIVFAMENADNRLIGLETQSQSAAEAVIEHLKTTVDDAVDDAIDAAESQLKDA